MNNDTPLTAIGDEALEARIVAWVLGEASAFEIAELERLCDERPELMIFKRRMTALHGMLKEAALPRADIDWKLPPAKRVAVINVLDPTPVVTDTVKEHRVRRSATRTIFSIAACLLFTVIILGLAAPMTMRQRKKADSTEALQQKRMSELAAMEAMDAEVADRHLEELNKAVRDQEDKVEERRKVLATIARTKGVIYSGEESSEGGSRVMAMRDEIRENAIKRDLDAQDYADAKRDFETDQQLLQAMKLKQIEETISRRAQADSGVDYGAARSRAKSSKPASDALASNKSNSRQLLRTDLPAELIEGTPVPMNVPNLEKPADGPAGVSTWRNSGRDGSAQVAARELPKPRVQSEPKPAAPSSSVSKVIAANPVSGTSAPVTEVDVSSPSLDFGSGNDFGVGWGGEGGGKVKEQGQLAGGVDIVSGAKFKNEKGLSEPESNRRQAGQRRGSSNAPEMKETESELSLREKSVHPSATPLPPGQPQNVDQVRRNLHKAEGNLELGKYDDARREYEEVLRKDPYNSAARRGMEKIAAQKSDYYRAAYDHTRTELLSQVDSEWELAVPAEGKKTFDGFVTYGGTIVGEDVSISNEIDKLADMDAAELAPDLTKLTEEIPAAEEPYSTFSLNISDASFRIAQAAIAKGERPDPAGVKVEQFYNAVDYGDPAPGAGQPVSCVIEQAAHPVIPGRNLVRVALKTAAAGRSAAQPLRLTLLVDQSGSMSRADRRAAMDTAMRSLGTLLTDKDLVTVIGFSRKSRLLAVDLKGNEVGEKLAGLVNQSASEGGTNLEEAIKLAEQMALNKKLVGAQNRIVLFTDGAANLGDADPQRLAAKVEQLRQQGIAFDIAGIAADDLNDELLAELARKGNGRYSVVGKGEEQDFAKQLAGAFRPAAENVKVQVRFNPERVARYKLIGFEKDRLKTEDFRNDAVDAAELAAEETGVAIYQVEPLPDGRGEIGEVSVRFRETASGEMVERMWTMSHDPATPTTDRAAPSMQLAVLAMLAGEKLKGGPLAEAIDFKQLAEPQATMKQAFGQDTRVTELLRMLDALK